MFPYEYSNKVKAMRPSIIRELFKQMTDPKLISFAGGNPAQEAFPVQEIREISHQLLGGAPEGMLQYSVTEGYPALRERGRAYVNRQWTVAKQEDDLIVLSGSQQVMDYMSRLLCNDGDVVAVEEPVFIGALNAFRANGARLAGVPLQADGVDVAALEALLAQSEKPKFYYTIPNFQNPTGRTTSLEKRRAVYRLCKQYGVPILEDNPYGDLRFAGEELPPIKSFDTEGLVLYAASLSKVFAPGMRIALCVGARDLMARFVVVKQGNDVHTNLWGQRVIERFFAAYDFDAHLERLRAVYRRQAQRMMDGFAAELSGKAGFTPVQGGMFLWLSLADGIDMPDFVRRCLEKRLALVPGNAFFVDDAVPCQSVRCNFSTPTLAQIDEGVAIMKDVLAQMG